MVFPFDWIIILMGLWFVDERKWSEKNTVLFSIDFVVHSFPSIMLWVLFFVRAQSEKKDVRFYKDGERT
jgi:hypothetical protein